MEKYCKAFHYTKDFKEDHSNTENLKPTTKIQLVKGNTQLATQLKLISNTDNLKPTTKMQLVKGNIQLATQLKLSLQGIFIAFQQAKERLLLFTYLLGEGKTLISVKCQLAMQLYLNAVEAK